MEHAAPADAAAFANRHACVEDALLADFRILSDVDMRIENRVRADFRMFIDDGKRHDRSTLRHLGALRYKSQRAHACRDVQRRREKLQELGESGARLLHIDRGQREVLHILGQEDGRSPRRFRFLDMRRRRKGDLRIARRFDVRRARDDDALIACKASMQKARNLTQRLFHCPSLTEAPGSRRR